MARIPDPPTLAFLLKEKTKAREIPPTKARVVSLRGTPKFLGNGRKKHKKEQGKSEKKRKKSKRARVVGKIQTGARASLNTSSYGYVFFCVDSTYIRGGRQAI